VCGYRRAHHRVFDVLHLNMASHIRSELEELDKVLLTVYWLL
jgi:hypothetical protein